MKTLFITILSIVQFATADDWIAFDTAPAGTPPTITYIADQSSVNATVFDITIHGVWKGSIADTGGQGEVFDRIRIPNGSLAKGIGKPEVPGVPFLVGLMAADGGATIENITVLESTILENIHLAPAQLSPEDTPNNGGLDDPLVPFVIDYTFYKQHNQPWPPGLGEVFLPMTIRGAFRAQPISPRVVQYLPSSEKLLIHRVTRIVVQQPTGNPWETTISRRLANSVQNMIPNFDQMLVYQLIYINNDGMNGNYLFVTPKEYVSNLWPLVQQKLERGYKVTFKYTENLGTNPAVIKTKLESWFNNLESDCDAYCLFVGDEEDIPMHPDVLFGSIRPSDYWYSCVEDELFASFGLGRLSVDHWYEVDEQVAKILNYSENPPYSNAWYKKAHTTVHWNTTHGFTASADDLESAHYIEGPLSFTRRTGTNPSDTVQDLINDVNEGQHFMLYFGHGSDSSWAQWTSDTASLRDSDLESFDNGNKTPIVYSAGCQTSSIHQEDECHSERWMLTEHRAVVYIGATRNYWRTESGILGKQILLCSHFPNMPNISRILLEAQIWTLLESAYNEPAHWNLYETQLLGDPEMKVWTESPHGFTFSGVPLRIPVNSTTFDFGLFNLGLRIPAEGAIAALYFNGESIGNAFADANGEVSIPVSFSQTGTLIVRAWDDTKNMLDTIATVEVVNMDCVGDLNYDGSVDVEDLLFLIASWGDCPANGSCDADLNSDGEVAVDDLLVVIAAWGACP
jgi:hypothetical protein